MFKFVIVILACSLACNAAPIDSKVDDSSKKNLTESSSEPRAISYTNSAGYLLQPRPYVSSYYSVPSSGQSVISSPLKPTVSLPYQSLFSDAKTIHRRPQLYSQSYNYPSYQSYQSYPQYGYSYGGYPSQYGSYPSQYGSYYGSYYKQAENQEMDAPATPVIVEQPAGQPNQEQVSNSMARDASWSPVQYTALPQDNFGQVQDIRQRDIIIDDKFNMQIQPSYLMNRLHLQSNLKSDDSSFGPAAGPEDEVYIIMNQYEQPSVAGKAALDDSFPTGNGQINSIWMQPVFNTPVTSNLKDGGLPYPQENILSSMNQFYLNQYMRQMAQANQNLTPKSKSADQTNEEQLVQILAKEILKKYNEGKAEKTEPSQPAKVEEKKETSTPAPKA